MAPRRPPALPLLALALAGCNMSTSYVPRTPHVLALAMKRGEPALYKDGVLTDAGDAPAAVRGCAPAVVADASEAASRYSAYRRSARLGGMFNALGVFAPPMFGVGIYFQIRAADHQQRSSAHLVDAINRHNDEPGCQR